MADDDLFPLVHALRVKGFAPAGVLPAGLDDAVDAGLVALRRAGAISGYTLTAAGRTRHAELLAADQGGRL